MRLFSSIPALMVVAWGLLVAAPVAAQEAPPDELDRLEEPPPLAGAPRALAGPTVLDRLEALSPEQRQRLLATLPPERRQRIEARLKAYESLPQAERDRLRRQYDKFRALTPEQKETSRRLFRRFMELPPGRRQVLRQEANRLSQIPWPQRQARIASPDFQRRFTPEERQILHALAAITPNP
ncbi:MAG: DUF3106 domain-containing protein [Bryobacteraceae bacterium]